MREWDDEALRVRYGAPFGLVLSSPGSRTLEFQDCLAAIRNVQWSNGRAPTLGSGCGFVKESATDREWAELKLKRDSVKKVLNV
jgi:isochorismate synthase EntC